TPHDVAILDAVSVERFPVRLAGADEHLAVVNERRSGVAPFRPALGRVLIHRSLPDEFAGGQVETIDDARRAEGVDASLVDGRGRARADAAVLVVVARQIFVLPNEFAVEDVEADNRLIVVALLECDRAIADDGEPGPRRSDGLAPEHLRWRL